MTVASETRRSGPYNGNGVTTAFDYEFKALAPEHLKVIRAEDGVETILVLDADYTVSGVGDDEGQITTAVAPSETQTITIIGNIPLNQETDLENQGAYYAETVEAALDLAVMRDQQLSERMDRALVIPASSDAAVLAGLTADILRLADSADAIDTVAAAVGSVETVAGNIAAVNTVAGIAPAVSAVAAVDAAVSTVAAIDDDVSTVAGIAANVSAVAAIDVAVAVVALKANDVSVVAAIDDDVSTVASNIADVQSAYTNAQAAIAAKEAAEAAAASVDAENLLHVSDIATVPDILSNTNNGVITTANAWDAAAWVPKGDAAGALTVDANDGVRQVFTLTGNVVVEIINAKSSVEVMFIQDATGGRTIGWSSSILFPNGVVPAILTTAGVVALIAVLEPHPDPDYVIANGWHL